MLGTDNRSGNGKGYYGVLIKFVNKATRFTVSKRVYS
ncbi:MAG: hypothetical protein ACI823_002303 [Chitinophagales bacterium]|jgi:hypothetical protein